MNASKIMLFFIALAVLPTASFALKVPVQSSYKLSPGETLADAKKNLSAELRIQASERAGTFVNKETVFKSGEDGKPNVKEVIQVIAAPIVKMDVKYKLNKKTSEVTAVGYAEVNDKELGKRIEAISSNKNVLNELKRIKKEQEIIKKALKSGKIGTESVNFPRYSTVDIHEKMKKTFIDTNRLISKGVSLDGLKKADANDVEKGKRIALSALNKTKEYLERSALIEVVNVQENGDNNQVDFRILIPKKIIYTFAKSIYVDSGILPENVIPSYPEISFLNLTAFKKVSWSPKKIRVWSGMLQILKDNLPMRIKVVDNEGNEVYEKTLLLLSRKPDEHYRYYGGTPKYSPLSEKDLKEISAKLLAKERVRDGIPNLFINTSQAPRKFFSSNPELRGVSESKKYLILNVKTSFSEKEVDGSEKRLSIFVL